MYEIEFYIKPNGRCPTEDFLDSINKKVDIPYIENVLGHLQEHGPKLTGKHVKYLEDGIYELRIQTVSGQFRLLYFFFDETKIIITHGFHKKEKKKDVYNPQLKTALQYKQDYYDRND